MKKSVSTVLSILVVVLSGMFVHLTNEYDPAFRPHPTTWEGKPGYYGCLHRDGWYTFYNQRGVEMTSLPAGEAFHLH